MGNIENLIIPSQSPVSYPSFYHFTYISTMKDYIFYRFIIESFLQSIAM